jgi:deoxycytidine triphosphate deaminase
MKLCREDIIRLGLVKGASEDQYQPNGVDLRIKEIYHPVIKPFWETIGDRDYRPVDGIGQYDPSTEVYTLQGHYLVRIAEVLDLRPKKEFEGYAVTGFVVPRSSFVRRCGDVCSAFWETGYRGSGIVGLSCPVPLQIRKGDRFCQVVFDLANLPKIVYRGQYQNEGLAP